MDQWVWHVFSLLRNIVPRSHRFRLVTSEVATIIYFPGCLVRLWGLRSYLSIVSFQMFSFNSSTWRVSIVILDQICNPWIGAISFLWSLVVSSMTFIRDISLTLTCQPWPPICPLSLSCILLTATKPQDQGYYIYLNQLFVWRNCLLSTAIKFQP